MLQLIVSSQAAHSICTSTSPRELFQDVIETCVWVLLFIKRCQVADFRTAIGILGCERRLARTRRTRNFDASISQSIVNAEDAGQFRSRFVVLTLFSDFHLKGKRLSFVCDDTRRISMSQVTRRGYFPLLVDRRSFLRSDSLSDDAFQRSRSHPR